MDLIAKEGKLYVVNECPMCGETFHMKLNEDEAGQVLAYISGFGYIQDIQGLNPVEREFIKTGYCPGCQKLLFGNGATKRIQPGLLVQSQESEEFLP